METSPYDVVRQFESEIAKYTGAPYAVAVSSCTEAIMLACAYWRLNWDDLPLDFISIPKKTYVGVPMSIIHAGTSIRHGYWQVKFEDTEWVGEYQIKPLPVWDSAKLLTSGMYRKGQMQCISLHWSKTLAVGWGGVILHDSPEADKWLRRARFDGRSEGLNTKDDKDLIIGWHCMMSPAQAAEALTRLSFLPRHNEPQTDDYPDLSTYSCFQ